MQLVIQWAPTDRFSRCVDRGALLRRRVPSPPVASLPPRWIAELPAVQQQAVAASSFCATTVGVAESQSLDITTSIDDLENGLPVIDPCAEGRRVAEAIVATLPPA